MAFLSHLLLLLLFLNPSSPLTQTSTSISTIWLVTNSELLVVIIIVLPLDIIEELPIVVGLVVIIACDFVVIMLLDLVVIIDPGFMVVIIIDGPWHGTSLTWISKVLPVMMVYWKKYT